MPEVEKGFGSSLNHKKARVIEKAMDFEPLISVATPISNEWEIGEGIFQMYNTLHVFFDQFALSCDYVLKDEKLIESLRNEKFDLGLTELFGQFLHCNSFID